MKLTAQFGLGEIVITNTPDHAPRVNSRRAPEEIGKVIAITFDIDGRAQYLLRLPDGRIRAFMGSELSGDPDFNHDAQIGSGYAHMKDEV
jgi:hypothetical protein